MMTKEKQSIRRKPCLNATFSTTNLTRTDLGSNPGHRGERPASESLNYRMDILKTKVNLNDA